MPKVIGASRPAGQHDVRHAELDQVEGLANGMAGGRAGGGRGQRRSLRAKLHADLGSGGVVHDLRDGERMKARGVLGEEVEVPDSSVLAPPMPVPVTTPKRGRSSSRNLDAARIHGFLRGQQGELAEAIQQIEPLRGEIVQWDRSRELPRQSAHRAARDQIAGCGGSPTAPAPGYRKSYPHSCRWRQRLQSR